MKLLVCGGRDLKDYNLVWCYINYLCHLYNNEEVTIIHGNAEGADKLAGEVANDLRYKCEVYQTDWNKYGRAAGPLRNQQMLDEGNPTKVLAFWNGESKGTLDMITKSVRKNKIVIIVSYK